jgi:formate-dependent nitrite reductase membrane component NrfD
MTIAALAQAAAAPAFNADFYTTAAAVIPTLFIAVAVQHGAVENLLTSAVATSRTAHEDASRYWRITLMSLAWTVVAFAYLTLTAGGFGEAYAIGALFYRNDTLSRRIPVLIAVVLLTVAVTVVPLSQFSRGLINMLRPDSLQAEPDKTDPA